MCTLTRGLGLITMAIALAALPGVTRPAPSGGRTMAGNPLPTPRLKGRLTLEECLARRRSQRAFTAQDVSVTQVSQLLWAAQGTTSPEGLRTAPSAGGCYPLELYVVRKEGIFRYRPQAHALAQIAVGDHRADLQRAALDQTCVGQAPCVFVLAAEMARTARRYGPQRAPRYVWMEAGHAAQNLLLQATALGLGAVPVGAFDDEAVRRVVGLPELQIPLYLIPVGQVPPHGGSPSPRGDLLR